MGKNKYYCNIDGVVHNLSDVQEVLGGKSERNIVLIMNEEHGMDIVSANTFESVLRFHNNEIPSDYNEALRRWQEYNQARMPKSPPSLVAQGVGAQIYVDIVHGLRIVHVITVVIHGGSSEIKNLFINVK